MKSITKDSILILKDRLSSLENVKLDGYAKVSEGDKLVGDHFNHKYIQFVPIDANSDEVYKIRGYQPKMIEIWFNNFF